MKLEETWKFTPDFLGVTDYAMMSMFYSEWVHDLQNQEHAVESQNTQELTYISSTGVHVGHDTVTSDIMGPLLLAAGCFSGRFHKKWCEISNCKMTSLRNLCRQSVRICLLKNNLYENMFHLVKKLPLPIALKNFIVFNVELTS